MVTGIEVAGLVLGSVPLLISALEHYSQGLATLSDMRKWCIVFDDLIVDFGTAVSIYEGVCSNLLRRSGLDEQTIYRIFKDKDTSHWGNPVVKNRLEKTLGSQLVVHTKLIQKLNYRVEKIRGKLDLNTEFQPCWVDANGDVDEKKRKEYLTGIRARIKGGFRANKLDILVQKFHRDVNKLDKLQSSALAMEPIRIQQHQKLIIAYLHGFREKARILYGSLNTHFEQCSCRLTHHHQTDLQLEIPRVVEKSDDEVKVLVDFRFSNIKPIPKVHPLVWRIEVETHENLLANSLVIPTIAGTTSVIISAPSAQCNTPSSNGFQGALSGPAKLNDLCKALFSIKKGPCSVEIGFIEDQRWRHHVYCLAVSQPNIHKVCAYDGLSLHEIFYQVRVGHGWGGAKSPPKERSLLALNLAYAVLQLHGTQWLEAQWGMSNILVHQKEPNSHYIDNIYVSRNFNPTNAVIQTQHRLRRWIPNETIFSLGIVLLELAYGEPLKNFLPLAVSPSSGGGNPELEEYETANKLCEDLEKRDSKNFADATRRCIRCNFDTAKLDLEDPNFREKFYGGVIVPLEEDYRHLFGSPSAHWGNS